MVLSQINTSSAVVSLGKLLQIQNDSFVRGRVAKAFQNLSLFSAKNFLLNALEHEQHTEVKLHICEALIPYRTEHIIPVLLEIAQDENVLGIVRLSAIDTLSNLDDEHIIHRLENLLLSDEDPEIRISILRAFQSLDAKSAVPTLLECLKEDDNINIRVRSARTIGQLGNKSHISTLLLILKSETDYDVRWEIVKVIASIADQSLVSTIANHYKNTESFVYKDGLFRDPRMFGYGKSSHKTCSNLSKEFTKRNQIKGNHSIA